jgi:tetratricopeptide (TPR) repeat protein
VGFLVLYLACGLVGSLASVFCKPLLVSAGASGAIFGVIGALLGFLLRCRGSIPLETLSALRNSGLAFVLYNLPLGLMHKEVDVAAHVGGLVAGFLCGLAMGQPVRPEAAAGRRARNLWVAVGALACVTLAILALSKIGESEEFARQRAEALKGEPIGPENEEMPKIRELLESVGRAFRAADGTELKELFDVDRMYEEVRGLGVLKGIPVAKDRQIVEGLRNKLPELLAQVAEFASYARFDIKNRQFLAERGEAVLSVRHWAEDGRASGIRWWLKKRGGRWLVYDFEEIRFPLRFSGSMAIGISHGRENPRAARQMRDMLPKLITVARAVMQGDLDTAENALTGIDDSQWPGVLKACRALLQGAVHLGRERPAEALSCLDRAERLHSDMPVLSLLRAGAFNVQGEHAKAKAMAEKYIEQVGGDADIYFQLGCALAGLGRKEEAAEAHRKGLDDDPSSLDNLLGLAAVLPEGQKGEVGRRFAKLQRPAEQFQAVWQALVKEGDTESIEAIVAAYARVQPDRAKVVEAFHQLAGLYRGEESYDKLAWLLATCPEEKVRDGRQALEYARKACELAKWQDERCLEILAAAYAELGRFGEAVKWQKKVLESPGLAKKEQAQLRARLELYEEGKPYREAR